TALTLAAANMRNVETWFVNAAANLGDVTLDVTMANGNVAAGKTLLVASGITTGSLLVLHFDGSAETDGHYTLSDNEGNDVLIGGAQSDLFNVSSGGTDSFSGG